MSPRCRTISPCARRGSRHTCHWSCGVQFPVVEGQRFQTTPRSNTSSSETTTEASRGCRNMRTNVAESPHFSFRAPEAQVWQVVVAAAVLAMLGSTSIVKAKLFRVKTVATHTLGRITQGRELPVGDSHDAGWTLGSFVRVTNALRHRIHELHTACRCLAVATDSGF